MCLANVLKLCCRLLPILGTSTSVETLLGMWPQRFVPQAGCRQGQQGCGFSNLLAHSLLQAMLRGHPQLQPGAAEEIILAPLLRQLA